MTKLEQVARQALGALIKANHFHDYEDEITALREALAEQAEQSQLADASLEPVACKRCNGTGIVPDGTIDCIDGYELETEIECVKDCPECTSTTPPTAPNLNCKSVQRRLATEWGYVRKEEYDMAKVAVVRQMRDAAVKVCRENAEAWGRLNADDEKHGAERCADEIAALPVPSSSSEDCGEVQWRDLTDDEIAQVWKQADRVKASKEMFELLLEKNLIIARAIIAKLEEVNK